MANFKLEKTDKDEIPQEKLEPSTYKSDKLGLLLKLQRHIESDETVVVDISRINDDLYKVFETEYKNITPFNTDDKKYILAGAALASEMLMGLLIFNNLLSVEHAIEFTESAASLITKTIQTYNDTEKADKPFISSKKGIG